MAQRRKRARSPLPTKESLKSLCDQEEGISAAPLSAPAAADVYHLAVVNSCVTNEDIRLPTVPTPGLLSAFYAECNAAVESSATASTAGLTPWKAHYWLNSVAHVPLGRHSALPSAFRLRHDCVSRLHARVVYVRTLAMHRRFTKAFPCIIRETNVDREKLAQCSSKVVTSDEDSVTCVDLTGGGPPTTSPPPTSVPCYLLVNHSENPVYVGHDCVKSGRSAVLQEGDVVSFLECAFDNEGGVFDEETAAETQHSPCEEADAARAEYSALAEPTQDLVIASLRQSLPEAPQPTPNLALSLRRSHGSSLIQRRLCDVPMEVQEYVRWVHALHHRTASTLSTSTMKGDGWLVSRNHLVRARSIVQSAAACVTPQRPSEVKAEETDGSSTAPSPSVATPAQGRCSSDAPSITPDAVCGLSPDLHNPATADALRQWLDATEGMEGVADAVVSPLCARLTLDRKALRRVVAQCCRESAQRRSAKAEQSTAKREEIKDTVKVEMEETNAVSESFRVSLSPRRFATPTREASVVQSVLDELRRSRSEGDPVERLLRDVERNESGVENSVLPSCGAAAATAAAPSVRRSLHLDDDLIELFTNDGSPGETDAAPREHCSSSSDRHTVSMHSTARSLSSVMAGVRLATAPLPVYVFTRRSRSPDVYTRSRALLAAPAGRSKASAAAAGAGNYVYYFHPDDDNNNEEQKTRLAGAAIPVASVGSDKPVLDAGKTLKVGADGVGGFAWIDETEARNAAKKGRPKRRRRYAL